MSVPLVLEYEAVLVRPAVELNLSRKTAVRVVHSGVGRTEPRAAGQHARLTSARPEPRAVLTLLTVLALPTFQNIADLLRHHVGDLSRFEAQNGATGVASRELNGPTVGLSRSGS